MTQDELKKAVASAAIDYIAPRIESNDILGIGTGSTANFFIDQLSEYRDQFTGAVASSVASAERLESHGIRVFELNDVDSLRYYIDGADETNPRLQLIKGGGAALTREKIVAACSKEFVCIADESKWVNVLGEFPLPIEVIPMAINHVSQQIAQLGGNAILRQGTLTDNGCAIIDVHGLRIDDPINLENTINQITGVVTNGIFSIRPADVLLLGTPNKIKHVTAER